MDFIRPEVKTRLWRWREAAFGAFLALVGLRLLVTGFPVFVVFGLFLCALGGAFIVSGIRRARFRAHSGGAGVVEIDERRVTFFDSGAGASLSLDQVIRIEIETNDRGPSEEDMFWVFYQDGESPVSIPASAVGGDEMLDTLAMFPGADYEKVIAASQSTEPAVFLIWQKSRTALH